MKSFNVISGLPRSGSTLLCNILNQNPDFYAGSTSPLPELIGSFTKTASTCSEIVSALTNDTEQTTKKLQKMISSMIFEWYSDKDKIVFDKSRGWSFNSLLLQNMFQNIKIIVTVRDLRSIFGSIEKQHRKNPIFDLAQNPNQKTIHNRADAMLSPEGVIGQCVIGIEDVLARTPQNVFIMQYEAFTLDPSTKMRELYQFLEIEYYDHTFEDIKGTAEDVDALYLNKFPHEGIGTIKPTNRNEWQQYVPNDLAQLIGQRYPSYNQRFGYM